MPTHRADLDDAFVSSVHARRAAQVRRAIGEMAETDVGKARIWALEWAAWRGSLEEVRRLMPQCPPHSNGARAFRWAAAQGHLDVVEALIEQNMPTPSSIALAFVIAASAGHAPVVARLIPLANPKADHSAALSAAAKHGHLAVVGCLLPVSDPKAMGSRALCLAACGGHLPIVALLLPVSDPTSNRSLALRRAADGNHMAVLEALLPVSNLDEVWADLIQQERWPQLRTLLPLASPRHTARLLQHLLENPRHHLLHAQFQAAALNLAWTPARDPPRARL